MKTVVIAFLIGLVFLNACDRDGHSRMTSRETLAKGGADWLSPLESKWEKLSAGKPYSMQIVSTPSFNGEKSLRFELRPGETWVNRGGATFRTEIDTGDVPPMNAVKWYRFAIILPSDFPIEDNRLVLFQWHGSDKKYLGEESRIPVLAFRYRKGILSITMRHSPERIVRNADAVPAKLLFETSQFQLGKWNDFVVQAKWSFTDDGYINVWWDGKQVVEYHGPVGYNDDIGPYVQFGLYRDESSKTYISYISGVRGGGSAQDVGFVSKQPKATAP